MTDADDLTPGPANPEPGATVSLTPEVQADVREALQQVADLFGGGAGGDHSIFERLHGLGHLNDPSVRERLTDAMQSLRTANLQGGQGPVVMDLRGTEAGQALRDMLQGLTATTTVQTFSAPAQIFINGEQVQPSDIPAPAPSAPQIVQTATPAPDAVVAEPLPSPSQLSGQTPARQASIVEDASGGGFFGWLTRLLNGR